jgi:Fur family iron response transcriptional regulator
MTQQRHARHGDSVERQSELQTYPERAILGIALGCDVKVRLREVGLRPTRQRLLLASILFSKGDRHLTAEMLYEEATKTRLPISLATVYNTLHHFVAAGLLRQVAVDGSKTYFDTNTRDHHHFFIEGENAILDIPSTEIKIGRMMAIPDGYEISRVDMVVRLVRKSGGVCLGR